MSSYFRQKKGPSYKKSGYPRDYYKFSELRAKCKRLSKLNYLAFISYSERYPTKSPKKFWKYVRDLKHHSLIPPSVNYLDSSSNNNFESSSLFSNYFSSVYKAPSTTFSTLKSMYTHPYDLPSNTFFTPDDVLSAHNNLKHTSHQSSFTRFLLSHFESYELLHIVGQPNIAHFLFFFYSFLTSTIKPVFFGYSLFPRFHGVLNKGFYSFPYLFYFSARLISLHYP